MTSSTAGAVPVEQLVHYLDDLLDIRNVPDYSNALNGLQLANQGAITKIAAAVDFSSHTIGKAIEAGANLLIVHHGMFWGGLQPLRGAAYARMKALIENDVAVYASHLPLDKHAVYGNNALLAHMHWGSSRLVSSRSTRRSRLAYEEQQTSQPPNYTSVPRRSRKNIVASLGRRRSRQGREHGRGRSVQAREPPQRRCGRPLRPASIR